MAGLKKLLFVVVAVVCIEFSYGGLIPGEPASAQSTAQFGLGNEGLMRLLNPVKTALSELEPQQPAYRQWVEGLYKTAMDLLNLISGFAPYLAKLANPIMKATTQILEKGTAYVVDYIRSLPAQTVQNIQIKALELVRKLINMNLIRGAIRLFVQAII